MRCESFGDARHRVLGLNLARLAAVKSKYDSANVFRVNQTSCRPCDAAWAVTRRPLLICFCAARLPTRSAPVGVLSHMDNGGFPTLPDEVTNVAARCCSAGVRNC